MYSRNGDVSGEVSVWVYMSSACGRLEVKAKAPLVLLEVVVRPAQLAADVRRHRALLVRCTRADPRAQRAALHALTALCAHHAALLPKVPAILKLLYDEDIVEERAILEWAAKPSRKYASKELVADVRRRAAPFLDWLQHAEEDSSDNAPADDEDIEVRPASSALHLHRTPSTDEYRTLSSSRLSLYPEFEFAAPILV